MATHTTTFLQRAGLTLLVLALAACGGSSSGNKTTQTQPPGSGVDAPGTQAPGTQTPGAEAPAQFAPPTVPITQRRAGKVVQHSITNPSTGDVTAITLMEPTELAAGQAYPLVLHGHGYGGRRNQQPDEFQQRLRDEGYYVVSIDQRGFGESSGTVRIMSPDFEGQNLVHLLDWAEELQGLARYVDGRMAVGSYGGSYGGMYQYLLAAADPAERLRVIAPDMTPYDLEYSLASHNVPKSGWAAGLVTMGEVPLLGLFGDGFADELLAFVQKELVHDNTRGELTNQDPVVVESLARGLLAGKLAPATKHMLRYHSLRYFCDGEPAGAQEGFVLGTADPLQVPAKPLPAIDALISQGVNDTLFNFNEGLNAYQCLSQQGGDVRLITHQSGHILPVAPDLLPDWNNNMDWLYAMFRPPEFQKPGGNEHCGSIERFSATFAWFEEKLKGQTGAVDAALTSGDNVCLSLADGSAVHVKEVKKGGHAQPLHVDTPAVSGPVGLLASMSGSLAGDAMLQSQTVYTAPKEGRSQVLAGIPTLQVNIASLLGEAFSPTECTDPLAQLPLDDIVQALDSNLPISSIVADIGSNISNAIMQLPIIKDLPFMKGINNLLQGLFGNVRNLPAWLTNTASDALPLACDPVYFVALAQRPEGHQRWDVINGQITPVRGYGQHNIEMNGIATRLNPGDEVGLLIMGGHLQYPLSFSRDPFTTVATMSGTIGLPLLEEDDIVAMDFGEPEHGENGVFPANNALVAALDGFYRNEAPAEPLPGAANLGRYLSDIQAGFVPYPYQLPSHIQTLADYYFAAAAAQPDGYNKEVTHELGEFFSQLMAGEVNGTTPRPRHLQDLADVIAGF